MQAELDPIFAAAVAAGRVPGVAAMALDASGQVLFSGGYGSIDTSNPDAPRTTTATPAIIFSCTKLVTSVAALQLVEQGRLDLEAEVERYVPEIREIKLLKGFKEDGTPELVAPEGKVKVVHLLTHTSGFSYDFFDKATFDWRVSEGQTPMSYAVTGTKRDFSSPLVSEPGAQYVYGINLDWLGMVIERITGLRIYEYIARHISGPLGLETMVTRLSEEQDKRLLNIHAKDAQGKLTPTPIRMPVDPEVQGGGHGLYSSIEDYCQFLLAVLNHGTHPASGVKILEPETVKRYVFTDMLPGLGVSGAKVGEMTASITQATNEGTLVPGLQKGHSLAAALSLEDAPNGRKAGSAWWAGLSNCYWWMDPMAGKLGCVFSATLPFMDEDVLGLFDALERAVYGMTQAEMAGEAGSNFAMK